jgi:hypothetical protein
MTPQEYSTVNPEVNSLERYFYSDHSAMRRDLEPGGAISYHSLMSTAIHATDEPLPIFERFEKLLYLNYSAKSYALDAPLP